jgi:hypothetical protein
MYHPRMLSISVIVARWYARSQTEARRILATGLPSPEEDYATSKPEALLKGRNAMGRTLFNSAA